MNSERELPFFFFLKIHLIFFFTFESFNIKLKFELKKLENPISIIVHMNNEGVAIFFFKFHVLVFFFLVLIESFWFFFILFLIFD